MRKGVTGMMGKGSGLPLMSGMAMMSNSDVTINNVRGNLTKL